MSSKQVFLSHASQDVVVTRLIGRVLHGVGLSCFYSEEKIPVGKEFDKRILEEIHRSDVMLVIWTPYAAVSSWVNQEIGIAIGKNIPVWPVLLDKRVPIDGAMFRLQAFVLEHDPDPYSAIERLGREIQRADVGEPFAPRVDRMLYGREERTQELVKILRNEKPAGDQYVLRMQAGFSCFAISADVSYRAGGYHSEEHHRLLIQERQEVERLSSSASVRLILWPKRAYENTLMQARFQNLLKFLRSDKNYERIQVVLGAHGGGARYILDGNVLITGIKDTRSELPGYATTEVSYHAPTISAAIRDFDKQFENLWQRYVEICGADKLEGIRQRVISELEGIALQVR